MMMKRSTWRTFRSNRSIMIAVGLLTITPVAIADIVQRPPMESFHGKASTHDAQSTYTATRNLFWHESTFDALSICDQGYRDDMSAKFDLLVRSEDTYLSFFGQNPIFWGVTHYLQGNSSGVQGYSGLEPNLTVYDPRGMCLDYDLSPEFQSTLQFGNRTRAAGVEEGILMTMEYPAISSQQGRGPLVEAELYFFNEYISLGQDAGHYSFGIYYIDELGKWNLAEKVHIEPEPIDGSLNYDLGDNNSRGARKINISVQLPISTIVQARLTSKHNGNLEAPPIIFPDQNVNPATFRIKVARMGLWSETCVPDLISGGCLE